MRLAALVIFLAVSIGWAADLSAPASLTAEVGGFVSIPVKVTGEGELSVEAFAGLQLVGTPLIRRGEGLVNFLVLDSAMAGEDVVTLKWQTPAGDSAEAKVAVTIKPKARFSLRAPPGETVVLDEQKRYPIQVTNSGNATDTIHLELISSLSSRIEPTSLLLEPGASAEAVLVINADDTGEEVIFVSASSGVNPELKEVATIVMQVVPFAGANAIEGPALGYNLEGGALYQPGSVDYRVNGRLNGDLSEFVELGSDLTFEQTIELEESVGLGRPGVTGLADLTGDDWGVRYQGLNDLQRFNGNYGPYGGFFTWLVDSGYSLGASYDDDATTLSLSHQTTDVQIDSFRAGYRFDPVPGLSLTPSLGLTGTGQYRVEDYFVTSDAALEANFENDALLSSARLQVNYPFRDDPWRFDATISKRVQTPIGVASELSITPDNLSSVTSVNEEITEEVSLSQRFSYSGDLGFQKTRYRLSLGTVYSPLRLPLTLRGSVITSLIENEFGVGYSIGATYQFIEGVRLDASFADISGYLYGAGLFYTNEYIDLSLAYQHAEESDEVLFAVGGDYENLEGSLQARYDFFSDDYLLATTLGYTIDRTYQLLGGLDLNEEAFTFRVGANVFYGGGFATSEPVIDFFGGRIVGTVTGTVFHDLNRSGNKDANEPFLSDISVRMGSQTKPVADDGSFRLSLTPGTYSLELANLPADLGLRQKINLEVAQDESQEILVAVETVVGFSGVVIDDTNRDGALDEEETRVPYAQILLIDPTGEQLATTADDRGAFFFQNLEPGLYTVRLDVGSLPEFFEATTPPLDIVLKPGPFPRLVLGATAKPKEVKQTLNAESLSFFIATRPNPPPPGASLEVKAEVAGAVDNVVVNLGTEETKLELVEGQTYRGYIKIPEDAQGVANLTVQAQRGEIITVQQSLIIIDSGAPLATLHLSSAFVDPREPITATAEFFTEVEDAYLFIADKKYPLKSISPYIFAVTFNVPATPETYEVELWADGERYASTRFRVDEGN